MQAFQAIADANPGPRRASVAQLRRAGLQGVGGLRREGDERRRLRRHDPDRTSSPTTRTRRSPVFQEKSRRSPTTYAVVRRLEPGPEHRDARPLHFSRPAASSSRRRRPPSSTSGCTAADFSGFMAGRIALIQRGHVQLRRQGAQRPGRGCVRRHHLQRGQPRPHRAARRQPARRRGQPDHPDHPGGVHVVRHRRGAATTSTSRRHGSRCVNLAIQAIVNAERRRLQRDRGIEGRRQEPRRRRRCAPRRDLRRGHARQRVRLGDDPRHRAEDEERQPAEQAAVHLVRRRGAGPAGLAVLRQQPDRRTTSATSATTSTRT